MENRYRPSLSVTHITTQLAFPKEDDCLTWLQELNVKFMTNDPTRIDCKASASIVIWGKSIFLLVEVAEKRERLLLSAVPTALSLSLSFSYQKKKMEIEKNN